MNETSVIIIKDQNFLICIIDFGIILMRLSSLA